MSTILTSAIIDGAVQSVDEYIGKISGLNGELDDLINSLTSTDFIGDASTGYKSFYDRNIVPAVGESLIDSGASLTASIKNMLETIRTQLLNTVDPQLGENNASAGGGE